MAKSVLMTQLGSDNVLMASILIGRFNVLRKGFKLEKMEVV